MSSNHSLQGHSNQPMKRHKVEGPLNHYLSYIISIILTMLSFAAVIYGGLNHTFLLIFLVSLAIVQTVFQLYIWMHMKEEGHFFPALFLFTGAFVAITAAVSAVYWMWW